MVIHVMKNGRILKDIKDHKVRKEANPMIYEILEKNRREKKNGKL